ncbi:MAG TPA: hypothetical protein EYQ50_13005 [Verrucomicrobiales bacterium]|nr:hypothetical protein [Verrucomicrobiales bacterium]
MTALLTPELLSHIGNASSPREELVTRRDIRKYSISTDQRLKKYLEGDEAPPMFHIALFWDVVEMDQLKPDGIPVDALVPKFPLERAMAGGSVIDYHRKIYPGDELVATRILSNMFEKSGRQGPLIFCEVTMKIETAAGEPVITQKITRIMR